MKNIHQQRVGTIKERLDRTVKTYRWFIRQATSVMNGILGDLFPDGLVDGEVTIVESTDLLERVQEEFGDLFVGSLTGDLVDPSDRSIVKLQLNPEGLQYHVVGEESGENERFISRGQIFTVYLLAFKEEIINAMGDKKDQATKMEKYLTALDEIIDRNELTKWLDEWALEHKLLDTAPLTDTNGEKSTTKLNGRECDELGLRVNSSRMLRVCGVFELANGYRGITSEIGITDKHKWTNSDKYEDLVRNASELLFEAEDKIDNLNEKHTHKLRKLEDAVGEYLIAYQI